jgi:hypothetical protein
MTISFSRRNPRNWLVVQFIGKVDYRGLVYYRKREREREEGGEAMG